MTNHRQIFFILSIFILSMTPTSSWSHTKCQMPLPFGGWTEGCPHLHQSLPSPQLPTKHIKYNKIKIHNECYKPVRVAIVVKNRKGQWRTKSWWRLDPYEKVYLGKTYSSYFYYYAQSKQGSWSSNDLYRVIDGKNRGFKEVNIGSTGGRWTQGLTCK